MRVNSGQTIGLSVTGQGLTQQTQNLTGPQKFQQTLLGVTSALAGAAGAAAPFFPGGAVVSAAMSGFASTEQQAVSNGGVGAFGAGNSFGGGGGGMGPYGGGGAGVGGISGVPGMGVGNSYGVGGGVAGGITVPGGSVTAISPEVQMQQMQQQNMYFLQMQQQANQTSEQFSAISNLMKVRHDTNQGILQDVK
jgi:hypothetical protein